MAILDFSSVPVLVTGGAGFIGSHLIDALLQRGARVRVLDDLSTGHRENLAQCMDRIDFQRGDLRDPNACAKACEGIAYVFHQAALGSVPRSMADPATSIDVNVRGTTNLFAAARDAKVRRVVYASSSSVYGDSDIMPKREGQEGLPLSPYALSKKVDEQLADLFGRCYGMEFVGLRYFNVYGARQDPNGPYAAVVPRFFAACLAGTAPVIYGDGLQSRDFTYVGDVALANLLAASAPASSCGRAYNIGAGGTTTVRQLAEIICSLTRCPVAPVYEPMRAGDVPFSQADVTAASESLGFTASVDLQEGLRRTAPGQ